MKKIILMVIIIIGFIYETNCQSMLTIAQVYNFNIGDEFHFNLTSISTTPKANRYKITGKYYSPSNDTVFYIRLFNNYYTEYNSLHNPPLDYFYSSYTDTVSYTNLDSLFNTQFKNWPVNDTIGGNYFKDTLCYYTYYCGKLIYEYHRCEHCIFEGISYIARYGEGLGMVFYEEATPHQPQYDNINALVYYKKGSTICGYPDITGISEVKDITDNLIFYPNPTKDNLTIETNSIKEQSFEITNLLGQSLYTSYLNKKANVDVSNFPKGVYIIKINNDKESVVRKFVKE